MEMLSDKNFVRYAIANYQNSNCSSLDDFECDIRRIKVVTRYISRYLKNSEDIKERATLNNIIILMNVFGVFGACSMLFYKTPQIGWPALKSFLVYLNQCPEFIREINLYTDTIIEDETLLEKLKQI